MRWIQFTLLLATLILPARAEVPKLAPADAAKLVANGKAVLVDVREPAEWEQTGVAAPAVLLPKSDFDGAKKQWAPFLDHVQGKQLVLYCRTGHRAGIIAAALAEKGFNVANAGGFKDWQEAGLPVKSVKAGATEPKSPSTAPKP
jgi:rhodanese-related sulfurtransferase